MGAVLKSLATLQVKRACGLSGLFGGRLVSFEVTHFCKRRRLLGCACFHGGQLAACKVRNRQCPERVPLVSGLLFINHTGN